MARRKDISDDKLFSLAVVAVLLLAVSALSSAGFITGAYLTDSDTATLGTIVANEVDINVVAGAAQSLSVAQGSSANTNSGTPTRIANNGSVSVNLTVAAGTNPALIWEGSGGTVQLMMTDNGSGSSTDINGWTTFSNVNPKLVVQELGYITADGDKTGIPNNTAEVDFKVTAPEDEGAGSKTQLTFTFSGMSVAGVG